MPKYYGQDYNAKTRTGPVDRVAVNKSFQDEHPERNALLEVLVDRINMILAMTREARTRDASEVNYEDSSGTRTNVGVVLDTVNALGHARLHDIDSTDDHNGVTGAVEDNFASFDANGLPKDSGSAAASFDAAGAAATAVSNHEAEADPHPGYLTPTEGDAAYDPLGSAAAVASDLSDHEAEATAAHAASAISVDAAGFSGNLSGTDTDVQTALATIDGLALGSTDRWRLMLGV